MTWENLQEDILEEFVEAERPGEALRHTRQMQWSARRLAYLKDYTERTPHFARLEKERHAKFYAIKKNRAKKRLTDALYRKNNREKRKETKKLYRARLKKAAT
jgi:hypothetical protein